MNRKLTRREAISTTAKIAIGAVAVVAAAGVGTGVYYETRPKPVDVVTHDIGFLNYPGAVIQVVGIQKGFFADQNIQVNLVASNSGSQALQLLAQGKSDFTNPDISQVITARASGQPIKSVSILYHEPAYSVITLNQLSSPAQLEGLTVGSSPGNSSVSVFPAFAKLAGVDATKVKFVTEAFPSLFPSLLNGQVDGVAVFAENAAGEQIQLGKPLYAMRYSQFADLGYGLTYATNDNMIQNNPDLVKRYMKATWAAADWAKNNPSEAAALFVQQYTGTKQDVEVAEWNVIGQQYIWAGDAQGKTGTATGVGQSSEIQKNIDITRQYVSQSVPSSMTPADIHTNDFVG